MLIYSQNVFKLARTHLFVLLTYDLAEINCLIACKCDQLNNALQHVTLLTLIWQVRVKDRYCNICLNKHTKVWYCLNDVSNFPSPLCIFKIWLMSTLCVFSDIWKLGTSLKRFEIFLRIKSIWKRVLIFRLVDLSLV